jgi:hypothetical protein
MQNGKTAWQNSSWLSIGGWPYDKVALITTKSGRFQISLRYFGALQNPLLL